MSYELYIAQTFEGRNMVNGRFLKGHTPHNKGKKWADFLTKRQQRRCAKGWKNVEKYRCKGHPNAGRKKKQVVGIFQDGTWKVFPCLGMAAKCFGGCRENIGRCCRQNENPSVNKNTGKLNTDHQYKGVRWYFESDSQWTKKIRI